MNIKETKVMFNKYLPDLEIEVDEKVIECVQKYIYLRQKIVANPDHESKSKEE